MNKRTVIGFLSCLFLLTGAAIYFVSGYTDTNAFLLGICVRLGIVLLTFYLAWPTIEALSDRIPQFANGVILVAIGFFVLRPRLFPLIFGLAALTMIVHFGLRFMTKLSQTPDE